MDDVISLDSRREFRQAVFIYLRSDASRREVIDELTALLKLFDEQWDSVQLQRRAVTFRADRAPRAPMQEFDDDMPF